MEIKLLYKDNDNVIQLSSLYNTLLSGYVNNSSGVTARLLVASRPIASGTEAIGVITMSYVNGSNGNYRYTWDKADFASLALGYYNIEYKVADGGLDLCFYQFAELVEREV